MIVSLRPTNEINRSTVELRFLIYFRFLEKEVGQCHYDMRHALHNVA
jgi:hypothetical protein